MRVSKKSSWRIVWYSVLVWLFSILAAGFVILPWFYLVLPIIVFWTTVYYFRRGEKTLKRGLWVSLFWFSIVAFLSFLEIIGPYYHNVSLYFSDLRNWFLLPLSLLMPFIYTLILENGKLKRSSRRRFARIYRLMNFSIEKQVFKSG